MLAALLDLALPAESIEADSTGVAQFAARYGFLDKPVRIRCRVLDPAVQTLEGLTCPDMTLDVHSFSQLRLAVRRVIITENEINFLSLPSMPGGLAVFGAGYGWDALAQAGWLHRLPLYYWGDIDTHGFAILNQLRGFFPQVRSVLMDRATLEAHRDFWGHEDKPQQADLPHLTATERQLYDALRDNHLRQGLRLEQEHLGFAWVSAQLRQLP
ncbi:DUF2220 domain-containing protein [Castellaniella caeni]|uniref:DUF2220 domain-containing protein n=1 Tax=Castellaniella caeni TaxID=266123 RepID=UPI0027E478EC|nr:DUF2220 domain-containing protein [Castellaniella caeni]